jgi:TonB family protein
LREEKPHETPVPDPPSAPETSLNETNEDLALAPKHLTSEKVSSQKSAQTLSGAQNTFKTRVSECPSPPYPLKSRQEGRYGRVILQVRIASSGIVEWVKILQSTGDRLLDNAAHSTVLNKWRFYPAHSFGRPIASTEIVCVDFVLK